MEIFKPGTTVSMGPGADNFKGVITAVTIRERAGDLVANYEVSWFNGRGHECHLLEESEFRTIWPGDDGPSNVVRIGFNVGSP